VALGALPLRDEVEHVDLAKNRIRISVGGACVLQAEHDARKTQEREARAAAGAGTVPGREVRRPGRAAGL
jgi:hypothetical protein